MNHPVFTPLDPYNQILKDQVMPAAWQNPEPQSQYNLVVIGGGTAGLVTAAGAAGLGAKVALIEKKHLGGDCLNVGCVPSKAIIRAARAVAHARSAHHYGVHLDAVRVDFPQVMERLRRVRAEISHHDSAQRFKDLGVDVFLGTGAFTGPRSIEVGGQTLRFAKAVIATGARAATPSIRGLEKVPYLTNESLFSLTELPRRLAIIGAGPLGAEMAQAFAYLGSEVYLLAQSSQLLPREEPEAAAIVEKAMQTAGVHVRLSCETIEVTHDGSGVTLHITQSGKADTLSVDTLLIAAGRRANIENLGLEKAGVACHENGVIVNDHLQTSQGHIYACGDVCSRFQFTHAADFMARTVIQNALFGGRKKMSALTIPRCTYTTPEVAQVGLNEQEAASAGIIVTALTQPLSGVDRALIDGQEDGFVKILVKKGTDKIVGATIVAEHAGDLISEITVAMTHGIGLGRLASVIHPYPTQAEAIRKVGDLYHRTRLTPTIKSIFQLWLKWQRRN